MAYGSVLTDTVQSSTAATAPVFKDGNGTQIGTLCRAWVNFNGTGTVAIRGSFNVSSITDNGTGDYTINFTTAMPDANYSISGAVQANSTPTASGWQVLYNLAAPTTTACRIGTGSSASGTDCAYINVAIFR